MEYWNETINQRGRKLLNVFTAGIGVPSWMIREWEWSCDSRTWQDFLPVQILFAANVDNFAGYGNIFVKGQIGDVILTLSSSSLFKCLFGYIRWPSSFSILWSSLKFSRTCGIDMIGLIYFFLVLLGKQLLSILSSLAISGCQFPFSRSHRFRAYPRRTLPLKPTAILDFYFLCKCFNLILRWRVRIFPPCTVLYS